MRQKKFVAAAALLFSSLAVSAVHAQDTDASGLAPSALKQIQDFYAIKASMTPAEQKMSTNLVLLSRMVQGKLPQTLTSLVQLPTRDADGKFVVEVKGRSGSCATD